MPLLAPDSLWLAHGKRHAKLQTGKDEYLPRTVDHPAHWMLAVSATDDREVCTVYQVKGGPGNYRHAVEAGVSLNTGEFDSVVKVGTIPVAQDAVFKRISRTVTPQRCQDYVVQVLVLLAREGIVAMGVAEYHRRRVDKSVYAQLVDGPDPAVDVAEVFSKCYEFARKSKLGLLEYDPCLR
ncbi:hypothetical protein BJY00DRAFT_317599 [Aspergillus carlsbadensis]|nr:hypothetical protein BJY00DRAFT_317599 [Aspergillus carlsbadensis]